MNRTDVERRRARRVTYGATATLLGAGLLLLDAWPLSAYRLFSTERGDQGASLTLVAVAADGTRTDVPAPTGAEPLTTTTHLYDDLARVSPQRAAAMTRAWLELAGTDPATVDRVELERRTWETDRTTLDRAETSVEVVLVVEP